MSEEASNRAIRPEPPRWTVVARVLRPQGRRGEVLAEILTDFPESFGERKRFFLLTGDPDGGPEAHEVLLENSWPHKGRIVLKFADIDTIGDAEALGRPYMAVPREERKLLSADMVYIGDLIGMALWDVSHDPARNVGLVTEVIPAQIAPAMLQVGQGDQALLIPFAQAYLKNVDLALGRIEMELPAGLLEINGPSAMEREQGEKQGS